jgi:plasmid stabilization system protein ParE
VERHRLVYLIRGDEIIMVRVVHGARDFRRALGPRPWLGA